MIEVKPENLIDTVASMKPAYNMLISIAGVDKGDHFEVVYHLLSTNTQQKEVIKVQLDKNNPEIESISSLYSAADWHERETYDLLGIKFNNHPGLERILLTNDWIGHPLRKDYVNNDERLSWNNR